tara:strand:- start:426 stop:608 length:183 start_codon:yes stop_codon:yes gene_type:complete
MVTRTSSQPQAAAQKVQAKIKMALFWILIFSGVLWFFFPKLCHVDLDSREQQAIPRVSAL